MRAGRVGSLSSSPHDRSRALRLDYLCAAFPSVSFRALI
jgi:hypothetical protein